MSAMEEVAACAVVDGPAPPEPKRARDDEPEAPPSKRTRSKRAERQEPAEQPAEQAEQPPAQEAEQPSLVRCVSSLALPEGSPAAASPAAPSPAAPSPEAAPRPPLRGSQRHRSYADLPPSSFVFKVNLDPSKKERGAVQCRVSIPGCVGSPKLDFFQVSEPRNTILYPVRISSYSDQAKGNIEYRVTVDITSDQVAWVKQFDEHLTAAIAESRHVVFPGRRDAAPTIAYNNNLVRTQDVGSTMTLNALVESQFNLPLTRWLIFSESGEKRVLVGRDELDASLAANGNFAGMQCRLVLSPGFWVIPGTRTAGPRFRIADIIIYLQSCAAAAVEERDDLDML